MPKLLFEEETYQLIGACIKVHKKLGNGFSEAIYHEALEKELTKAAIPFEHYKKLPVYYEGQQLNGHLISDFVCYQKIIVELASVKHIKQTLKQQVLNHLRSTECQIGLLINFGEKSLTWKRFINT
jgi:GxxExxY protein